jgi:hypothetical protein
MPLSEIHPKQTRCYSVPLMATDKPFCVIRLDSLVWPADIEIPSGRFRLFVAADVTRASTELISEFAHSALKSGMVYFCAWGPDCERFHNIVDEVVVEDDIGERLFIGKNRSDTIMTTWHDDEPLNEALNFFVNLTCPTAGLERNSNFWVAVSLNNAEWAVEIQRRLEDANLPIGDWPPNVR